MPINEVFTEVPKRSGDVLRTLPKGLLKTYFDSIQAAHERAGLELGSRELRDTRPTVEEDGVTLQVGLALQNRGRYSTGWFIAARESGISVVQGLIAAFDGGFDATGTRGVVAVSEERGREAFDFRAGQNGSVAWISELIAEGSFVPGAAQDLVPWVPRW